MYQPAANDSRQQIPPAYYSDPRHVHQRGPPLYNNPQMAGQYPHVMAPQHDLQKQLVEPPTMSLDHEGKRYTLSVSQQPIRARMCGFGDKDRRPITPPPCIRLEVIDLATSRPVDINEIDTSYFILTVDLWAEDASKEVNLVRHSATSPSISATTSSQYPPPPAPPAPYHGYSMGGVPMNQMHVFPPAPPQSYGYPGSAPDPYAQQSQAHGHPGGYSHYQQQQPPPPSPHDPMANPARGYYPPHPNGTPITPVAAGYPGPHMGGGMLTTPQDPRSAATGMFTRNLIGSLCVSAFKLTDPHGELGVWFILQDLSVRTEGNFRLKMNFVNVGNQQNPTTLNTGSAPVLASCFSKVFQVFSAKKFPGVIESTALSKCFATQGIKIPIRKDGPGRGREDAEDERSKSGSKAESSPISSRVKDNVPSSNKRQRLDPNVIQVIKEDTPDSGYSTGASHGSAPQKK